MLKHGKNTGVINPNIDRQTENRSAHNIIQILRMPSTQLVTDIVPCVVAWFLQTFRVLHVCLMSLRCPRAGLSREISNGAVLDRIHLVIVIHLVITHNIWTVALNLDRIRVNEYVRLIEYKALSVCWQGPGPLNNNGLFDLPWNSAVCVIIFLSDAYSLTWLLWLQSALFVCMFDDEWAVNTFVLRGSLSSEAGRVQVKTEYSVTDVTCCGCTTITVWGLKRPCW